MTLSYMKTVGLLGLAFCATCTSAVKLSAVVEEMSRTGVLQRPIHDLKAPKLPKVRDQEVSGKKFKIMTVNYDETGAVEDVCIRRVVHLGGDNYPQTDIVFTKYK